jgi:nucleoside-diphosphate-sugar epimerase
MKILVTGANGLIGRALCSIFEQSMQEVVRAVRTSTTPWELPVGDLTESNDWSEALSPKTDVVVHLAAQVPAIESGLGHKAGDYLQVNTLATANLARQCASHGVRRFVFVSTAKVLGEGKDGRCQATDVALPEDSYAISKWDAEQVLWQISKETGMEVVIIRPPLVYGPGVKANFLQLMRAIDKGLPLPLGAIRNRRSLIYLGNLVDAISLCLTHPKAAGKTYVVSDNDDVSTPELVRRLAKALNTSAFLLPVPVSWMRFVGTLLGKVASVDRVVGSFSVDIAPIQKELGWIPPYSMEAGLAATAEWYRQRKSEP